MPPAKTVKWKNLVLQSIPGMLANAEGLNSLTLRKFDPEFIGIADSSVENKVYQEL